MYYVYVFMQRRMQNSHVIITQLRKLVEPPLTIPYDYSVFKLSFE